MSFIFPCFSSTLKFCLLLTSENRGTWFAALWDSEVTLLGMEMHGFRCRI